METQLAKREKLLKPITTVFIFYARIWGILFMAQNIKKPLFVNIQYELVKIIFLRIIT